MSSGCVAQGKCGIPKETQAKLRTLLIQRKGKGRGICRCLISHSTKDIGILKKNFQLTFDGTHYRYLPELDKIG